MKIVNLETFLSLPSGTIYSKYEPCCFSGLCIKGDSLDNDFTYADMNVPVDCTGTDDFIKKLFAAAAKGTSFSLDFDQWTRDACYDKDQLFAVYEKEDVEKMITKLQGCIKEAYQLPGGGHNGMAV